jgi:hypothetical protein
VTWEDFKRQVDRELLNRSLYLDGRLEIEEIAIDRYDHHIQVEIGGDEDDPTLTVVGR